MQKQKRFTNKEKTHSIEKDIELTEMMELADNDFKITIAGYMLQDLLMENINIIRKLEIKKNNNKWVDPCYGYIKNCLSNHPLMDIWELFYPSFWL